MTPPQGQPDDSSLPGFSAEQADLVLAEIDADETVDFLQSLIRVDTVNPPGDVRDAVELCRTKLADAGFACRIEPHEAIKTNLIAEFGSGASPRLAFNAHLDVVPTGDPSAWRFPPFGGEIVDGRVYGRGAGDDKASVTAQVMAGVALARSNLPLAGTLVVNEVADEETTGAGARHSIEGGFVRADMVIVGEQTRGRIAVGEKGIGWMILTVTGRTAHGALPWEGANAIEGMARVIVALERELQPRLKERTHPYFHPSSASVNLISGGVKANVVADRCEITIDRRLVPGEDPRASLEEVREIAAAALIGMEGLGLEVRPAGELRAATLSDSGAPVVQAMLAANRYLGLSEELFGFSMASDGRFFAAAGVPTIIYGPGDPKLAHVPDEWVGLDETLAATRAYALAALAVVRAEP
ncbi:MAG TPA: M20 family metallopeptidase [Thermomicrobiales bacterium]|nr:M20 family metallopeptidase [Thermomicrobiales bacterium]